MFTEENEVSTPYDAHPYQRESAASATVLGNAETTDNPAERVTAPQLPVHPYPPVLPPAPPSYKQPRRRSMALLLVLLLIPVLVIGLFAGWRFAGASTTTTAKTTMTTTASTSSSSTSIEAQQEAAINKVKAAVVELKVTTSQGLQIGSGVIIDVKGDIVTNNHVVSGEQGIVVVLSSGTTEQAQLVGTSSATDLAVIHIQPFSHMTVVQIGNSSSLVPGQEVLAIGSPLGMNETVTRGIVSALNRSVRESTATTISNAIQTDAALNPGNSGGALINLQGQLVGIPTLTAVNTESNTAANGLGFAIPSNLVQATVQQIL